MALMHDADENEGWTALGFSVVEPPADVEDPVLILAWGELPEDAEALLRARGLSWELHLDRSGQERACQSDELADDHRTSNALNLTAYCWFFRDTEILLYQDRDSRIAKMWPDELDHCYSVRSEHCLNVGCH